LQVRALPGATGNSQNDLGAILSLTNWRFKASHCLNSALILSDSTKCQNPRTMDTADEIRLEALLPAEIVAKIREAAAQALSQQVSAKVAIAGRAGPILEGNVLRPMVPPASIESSAVVNPQSLQELLKDPVALKKNWASPEGVGAIDQIGMLIAQLYTAQLQQETLDLQKQAATSERAKAEQVWIHSRDQPQPDPDPTPDSPLLGD
jgi:hypothetical protein